MLQHITPTELLRVIQQIQLKSVKKQDLRLTQKSMVVIQPDSPVDQNRGTSTMRQESVYLPQALLGQILRLVQKVRKK